MKLRLLSIWSIFIASHAYATDFRIQADAPITSANGLISVATDGDSISVALGPNRSYCCSLKTANLEEQGNFTDVLAQPGNTPISFADASFQTPGAIGRAQSRVCFTTGLQNFVGPSALFSLPMSFESTVSNLQVSCLESTLYGDFNTVVNPIQFLTLSNNGQFQAINAVVKGFSLGGSEIFSTNALIPTSGRLDIDIHSRLAGNQLGTISVTSDAPIGSLRAVLNAYGLDSTNSSGLALRGTQTFVRSTE